MVQPKSSTASAKNIIAPSKHNTALAKRKTTRAKNFAASAKDISVLKKNFAPKQGSRGTNGCLFNAVCRRETIAPKVVVIRVN